MVKEVKIKKSFQNVKSDIHEIKTKIDQINAPIDPKSRNVPVVILAGGLGTRLREETEFKPKPMVTIGTMPIIWHIMKTYSHYGFRDFIVCLGYKGNMIKNFFLNYEWMRSDFTLNLKNRNKWKLHNAEPEDWTVTFAETGHNSMTAKRIKMIEKYIDTDLFFMTYGDGLSDVNILELLDYHKRKAKAMTITGVQYESRFGLIKEKDGIVKKFWEKPMSNDRVNGGFMVLSKDVFDYIDEDKNQMFSEEIMPRIVKDKGIAIYKHDGYWGCMDTHRDYLNLNKIWKSGKAPWKVWD